MLNLLRRAFSPAFLAVLPACSESPKPPDVVALAGALERTVEQYRGLRFRTPVKKGVKDMAQMREFFQAKIYEDQSSEEMRVTSRVGELLGLLPPGYDVEKGALDFLEVGVGGVYDPKTKTFYLAEGLPKGLLKTVIVHEMTHALDDQYFRLDRFYAPALTEDEGYARAGVVEGSAMLVMNRYQLSSPELLKELGDPEVARFMAKQTEVTAKTPPYLLRAFLCGYIQGPVFLGENEGGDAKRGERLFEAFTNPPRSSEQILHPEKYWDSKKRDEPRKVRLSGLAQALGDGWKKVGEDTFGELTLALLTQASDEAADFSNPMALAQMEWTNEGAAGWGGDRWEAYQKGEDIVVFVLVAWDREEDAEEFRKSYRPPAFSVRVLTMKNRTLIVASKKEIPGISETAHRAIEEASVE